MSFQQGLCGLDAAAQDLDVIGNNVANSNTYGFKSAHRPVCRHVRQLRRRRQPLRVGIGTKLRR